MLNIRPLTQLFHHLKQLLRFGVLFLLPLIFYAKAYAQTPSCNLNELRLNGEVAWNYLARVTAECGMPNPNNVGGHLRKLRLPMNIETRGVARQIEPDVLYRFAVILVTGYTDSESGQFVPDSIVLEISSLQNTIDQRSDPLSQLGSGIFILRVDLSGNFKNGLHYKNGRTLPLGNWDAETVMDYALEYWQDYYDSADFIESSGSLAR